MRNRLFILGLVVSAQESSYAEDLNWDFIHRGGGVELSEFQMMTSGFPVGSYLVELTLNQRALGKRPLDITHEDSESLCLSYDWLRNANIDIDIEYYAPYYQEGRDCYDLSGDQYTTVEFDFSTQELAFLVPQKGLAQRSEAASWDYGIPAVRLNYNLNGNVNEVESSVFSSAGVSMNLGRWVGATSVSVSDSDINVANATFSRALYSLKADLTVGQTHTGNSLVGSSSYKGLGITSNSSMEPGDVGYSPVFSGIAQSDARVTLVQNGNAIYSELVPPGPFEIRNVSLLSRGDVLMTVTENDGTSRTQLYPLTLVPNMLTLGQFEYGLYSGLRESSDNLPGVFLAGNFGYGFENVTLAGDLLLHAKYKAFGASAIKELGEWGTVSLEGSVNIADNVDASSSPEGKGTISYSKVFNDLDLQLSGTAYSSENYVEFSEYSIDGDGDEGSDIPKAQFELSMSQDITNSVRGSASVWRKVGWDESDNSTNVNVSLSSQFEYFSVSLGASMTETDDIRDFNASLSVSVPLQVFSRDVSSFGTVSASSTSTSYSAGVSSSFNDKMDYSVSSSWGGGMEGESYSLRSSYRGDRANVSAQISHSADSTTGSGSVSGSMIYLPTKSEVLFTRNLSDTIVVANIDDVEGVEFSSSPYPTDINGNAVIPVTPYHSNEIILQGATLPAETELLETSKKVTPSGKSVVYMPFQSVEMKRYLFQVKDSDGNYVPMGTWAKRNNGSPLGFVTQNGVLFVNSIDELEGFSVGNCHVASAQISHTSELQIVECSTIED